MVVQGKRQLRTRRERKTQQVLDEWNGVSRPLLNGGQGKQDGRKRLSEKLMLFVMAN